MQDITSNYGPTYLSLGFPDSDTLVGIGCGGGFQQECGQHFSPVAEWMSSVDLFLEDEGQQYGNMEEAASVARTPATCLEV